MEDLNKILGYYPKLKKIIDKDKPKIYNNISNTQYVKNGKINSNIGLIYDFGGAANPVKGKNVVIVDEYNPTAKNPSIINKNYYDKDIKIYKYDDKNKNITLPDTLEINGSLSIAYANIVNFPKYLKVKELSINFCSISNYMFDSKLIIEKDLKLSNVSYNDKNILDTFAPLKFRQGLGGYVKYGSSYGYPESFTKIIKDKIIQNGGQVGGDIIVQ
jgi:hypothetical protein